MNVPPVELFNSSEKPAVAGGRERQQSARGDRPLLIPGAWEARASTRAIPITKDADSPARRAAPASGADRERLEHELEGGGAPSQRRVGDRPPSLLGRLWRASVGLTRSW